MSLYFRIAAIISIKSTEYSFMLDYFGKGKSVFVVELHNHELNEQLMLTNQLDEEEKTPWSKLSTSCLPKKDERHAGREG
ncbi:hypothetical protein SAMN05660895_1788 [Thermoflavifilum thermophilum]|uniref:Uncharacterized protein n=2 Tax=Thermoflavifilum thermophilum TaxID=1393122 RepID=A0A1I7NGB3_9BACT|nr:hypothetical protein SAMN05660895_1788 [Thermoflavifilum thermophilum]